MPLAQLRRILLTGDTEGGVWTFVLELAEGLLNRGVEVCLVTFGPTVRPSQKAAASEVSQLHWLHHCSKLEWMHEPWTDIDRAGHWLRDVAKQWKPDLIHLNTLCHGALDWNMPVVMTHHSSVTSWWRAVRRSSPPREWFRYQREVKRSLEAATMICAPSQAGFAAMSSDYRLDLDRAQVVYNGRNPGAFRIGSKEEIILSAGRLWDKGKNLSTLAALAPRLPWPVCLAGNSQNLDGEAVVITSCRLLGTLSSSELSRWYALAAIYALPARYEPFGLSILEAGLSGCALVLGDIPSLREIWKNAAIFIKPDDTESLKDALCHLIANPDYRAHMGQLACCRAREFSQSRMVDGYLSVYQNALAKYERDKRPACAS